MLIFAFVIPVAVNSLLVDQVGVSLMLDSKSSDSYSGWQTNAGDPDAPVFHYDIYYFDYVNADQVNNTHGHTLLLLILLKKWPFGLFRFSLGACPHSLSLGLPHLNVSAAPLLGCSD